VGSFTYSMQVSLDGFVETVNRSLDFAIVDEEFHRFVNAQARKNAVFVNGRRLYEVMRFWETAGQQPDVPDYMLEFAEIWNATPKIVFSSTLDSVGPGASLIRTPDAGRELRRIKDETHGELDIGGPMLAATAIRLGLIDEFRIFLQPASLGGGTPFFPRELPVQLELVDSKEFGSGVMYLAYRPRR
jgi:dihydrofolate reductase